MTAENLVPSLDTCRALREAGFPQGTYLAWYPPGPPDPFSDDEPEPEVYPQQVALLWEPTCAAPTLQEVLAALPKGFLAPALLDAPSRSVYFHLAVSPTGSLFWAGYEHGGDMGFDLTRYEVEHENAAEAAARLYLALHAAGLLSPSGGARGEGA